MRAIIVDDERLARSLIKSMLDDLGVVVIGEFEDAEEALAFAEEDIPDLVFMDVRMPGISGIQASSEFANISPSPLVVMVTGYSEYALDAFDKSVFDYLVKPVSEERLATTILKAKSQLTMRQDADRVEALKKTVRRNSLKRLAIRSKGAIKLLPVDRVLYATAAGKVVVVKSKDGEFKTNYTLTQLESLLPGNFMRVHASCIANLALIDEVQIFGNHTYGIRLVTGEELPLGRVQYPVLQERLGIQGATEPN